jgi:TatD DNase family protein
MLNSQIHLDFDNVNSLSSSTTGVIIPSTGKDNWDAVIASSQNGKNNHFALGIHPWFVENHQMIDLYDLEVKIEEEKPIAVGECGLDYTKVKDQNTQRFFFDEQVALATRFDLPLIIHSVNATDDVTDLLKSYSKSRGVIHAFSGSLQQAENLLKINFSFGFGSTLTNPHAYKLHDIVKFLPIESIVIETDDRKNTDELIQAAERIARIKKLSVDQVIDQCDQNTFNIFNIS